MRPSTPEEYGDLLEELRRIYETGSPGDPAVRLVVVEPAKRGGWAQRVPPHHLEPNEPETVQFYYGDRYPVPAGLDAITRELQYQGQTLRFAIGDDYAHGRDMATANLAFLRALEAVAYAEAIAAATPQHAEKVAAHRARVLGGLPMRG